MYIYIYIEREREMYLSMPDDAHLGIKGGVQSEGGAVDGGSIM